MAESAAVFDVNETMLDLRALDPLFAGWFGDSAARQEWFAQTLHFALTLAATREFRGFGDVGLAALSALADRRRVTISPDAGDLLRQQLMRLPAHPDVVPALEHLRAAGVKTAALSNNPLPLLREQLRNAGLTPLFAEIMSVDEAAALKPAPEVYRYAVKRMRLAPDVIWMVAAHGWDIAGAQRAGLRGAFLARPGQFPDPFAPPEIVADDLGEVARAITDRIPPA
jgi:2-haloacid dehalogenase